MIISMVRLMDWRLTKELVWHKMCIRDRLNVLLTTHSPNFVLALDAYMRKYRLEEKSNFYQTQILEDGFVQYNCMDDDIGKIYEDFLQYLSEVKMLRSFYMRHGEEIESDEGMDEEG